MKRKIRYLRILLLGRGGLLKAAKRQKSRQWCIKWARVISNLPPRKPIDPEVFNKYGKYSQEEYLKRIMDINMDNVSK